MPPRDDLAARTGALFLYPFRARNPLTGKWYRARYLAERHEIAARYAEWEIIGPPEIWHPAGAAFNMDDTRVLSRGEKRRSKVVAPHAAEAEDPMCADTCL